MRRRFATGLAITIGVLVVVMAVTFALIQSA
jgi:hypothetical protein